MNASSESGVCPTEISTIYYQNQAIKNIRISNKGRSLQKVFQTVLSCKVMICASCENHKHFECIDCQNNHTTELCNCDCHQTEHQHND